MKHVIAAACLCVLLAGCKKNSDLKSIPVDPGGKAVGEVYVEIEPPQGDEIFRSSSGHSDRWLGGKSATGGVLPDPYIRSWWFDLIRPDGTYEGCAQFGWDPTDRTGFVLCRSWQNVDLRFVTSEGRTLRFEHRPVELMPISHWTFDADNADTNEPNQAVERTRHPSGS